jgi:vitamin B12 transporter
MRAIACAAVSFFFVLGLGAQESGSVKAPDVDAGQVDVSAEAYSPITLAPAGSVSVITADDIAKSGAASAADALAAVAGVWVNRIGPDGSVATASIGGSSSNQVLVIVDGVRLNDSRQGGADLDLIPAESIEKVEVLRGGASAAYGADAMGGVILVTTKKSGTPRLSLSAANTSYPTAAAAKGAASFFDAQSFGIDAGKRLGSVDVAFAGQAELASNAYPYGSSGSPDIRDNAGLWNGSGNLSVAAPLVFGRLSVLAAGSYQDAHVPGSLTYPSPQTEQKDSSFRGSLGWSSDALAGGMLMIDIQAHGGLSRLDLIDPVNPGLHDMANGGIDLRVTDSLSASVDLGLGSNLLYEAANSVYFDSNPDGQPSRLSLGAYVEPELRVGDRLKIKPALRYDWNDNYAAGLSAMLGAVWNVSDAVDLRLSGGRSYCAPTFMELYWPSSTDAYGDMFGGNPDLKPEVAWSGELGADLHVERLSLMAAISARYVDNLIADPYEASQNYIPYNVGAAFMPDASVEASYKIGPAAIKANYEFLYPLDLSNGKTIADNDVLLNMSQHKAGASADFIFGVAEAGIAVHYWSDLSSSIYSLVRDLKGAAIVDLNAAYSVEKDLRITIAVDNLLDSSYQITNDYPMPGLAVKVGAKMDF